MRTCCLIVFALLPLVVSAHEPPKHPVETKDLTLTITSDGKPVPGVSVHLYACRCEEDPGSHYGWPVQNIDEPTELRSDKDGKVEIKWPVKFGSPENWRTTTQISMFFRHPEFVPDELHIDPRTEEIEKVLKAGCELTFSAVGVDRQPVPFGVVIAGPGRGARWLRDEDGSVRSRAIPDGTWQTMLVSPSQDGRHLFSGVLPVRLANQQDVKFRNLKLRPGLRLSGELSENVPRPVERGRIQALCVPKPGAKEWEQENPSVCWYDLAEVQEDGSFEFLSLPRSGKVQLIAICTGWLGVNHGQENEMFGRVQGMVVDLEQLEIEDDSFDQLVVPMQETGTIQVTVIKPNETPLAGAGVSTNPNQVWLMGGSTIVGSQRRSLDSIYSQLGRKTERKDSRFDENALPKYFGKTDENGQVTLSGIPLNRDYAVGAAHENYILPAADRGRRKRVPYRCESAEPVEVVVKLEKLTDANDPRP